MNAEYKKAAEKLLCGITDKRLHEPAIWNDILSSARSGNLQLWEINDEILRIKYFCKEKTERASAFTESNKSGVRFDDLNAYLVQSVSSKKKVRKATGWIVLLIIAAFVGLFFVLKYLVN